MDFQETGNVRVLGHTHDSNRFLETFACKIQYGSHLKIAKIKYQAFGFISDYWRQNVQALPSAQVLP